MDSLSSSRKRKRSKADSVEQTLSRAYYDSGSPGSYGGASALRRRVGVSERALKGWLKTQDAYTLYKTPRRRFTRRKTIVGGINHQWQMDLIDLSSLKRHNRGMTFVLTAIDVFSKVAAAVPLKNKTSKSVTDALKKVFKKPRKTPRSVQTDKGREFRNKSVIDFLDKLGVHHFVSENDDIKCAVVERFNRTLKERLWRYFEKNNTRHYLRVLPRLVRSYNNSYHRSLGMAPSDVNERNQELVWQRLYGEKERGGDKRRRRNPLFRVGERVRISQTRRPFKKGYLPSWTTETFIVTEVLKTTPVTYRVEDERGERVEGTFYPQELQSVIHPEDKKYKIEKVLKRRGKRALVRWEGYPPSFDSWIESGDISKL